MKKVCFILSTILFLFFLSFPIFSPEIKAQNEKLKAGLNELFFTDDGQRYFLYVPAEAILEPERYNILVAVHGYSGRKNNETGAEKAEKNALRWAAIAEKHLFVVLSPHFDEERFDHYQTLNFSGLRADLRLNDLVDRTECLLPGIRKDKIFLFGFSGGGQFVHRYAAFHPARIVRAVAAGSGWYLWPDETLPYPVGLDTSEMAVTPPRTDKLLRASLLILVGSNDTDEDSFRRYVKEYDLIDIQGRTRIERARRWYQALEKKAKEKSVPFNIEMTVVPGAGHKISRELFETAAKYLIGGLEKH